MERVSRKVSDGLPLSFPYAFVKLVHIQFGIPPFKSKSMPRSENSEISFMMNSPFQTMGYFTEGKGGFQTPKNKIYGDAVFAKNNFYQFRLFGLYIILKKKKKEERA